MSSVPLVALGTQQPPSVLDQYSRLAQLSNMVQQQKLLPGQLQAQQLENQQRGQEVQSTGLDIQQKQLALQNNQIKQTVLSDPNFQKEFQDWQNSKGASNSQSSQPPTAGTAAGPSTTVPLHPLAQFLAEKKGLPLFGANGAIETSQMLTKSAQDMATLAKTQGEAGTAALKNHADQLSNFDDLVEPVLAEKDPAKQAAGLQNIQAEIGTHPELYPAQATQHLSTMNSIQGLQAAANTSKIRQMLVEDATKQSGQQTAAAEAQQKTEAAAAPSATQLKNATDTLATYAQIPPNMRAGLTAEMKAAPDWETLQKVQARADAANESFQRSADARQQALAMKDVGVQQVVAGKMVAEDQKLGTALNQTSGIRGLLDMSKGGNQQATAAAQVRFAEHEIVEGGVKRLNQTELSGLTSGLGDYGRQFGAWVDKGFQGKMPPATNSEMQTILDAEDKNANAAHERNVGYIQDRYAVPSSAPGPKSKTPKSSAPTDPFAAFGGKAHPQ